MKRLIQLPNIKRSERGYGLRFWLSVSLLFVLGICIFLIARKNTTLLRQNKEKDVWAIVYLETEKIARDLSGDLASAAPNTKNFDRQPAVYRVEGQNLQLIRGGGKEVLKFSDLGFKNLDELRRLPVNIVSMSGQNLQLLYRQGLLKLLPLAPTWLKPLNAAKADLTLYILNRQGHLVGANDPSIVEPSSRPLVQRFIVNPLSQGQQRFEIGDKEFIGFFHEIAGTNLVLFAEAELSLLAGEIWAVYRELLVYAMLIMLAGLLLLQWPLAKMLAPLTELIRLSENIARGNFKIDIKERGAGELTELSDAFTSMGQALVARDDKIKAFIEDEKNSIRLKNELAITSNIQQNFLPHGDWPQEASGLEIAARYLPADEAAGDWYQYFFDGRTRESVIVVADVSGHGAGAAMFTAIIASVFERYKYHQESTFPSRQYLKEANALIYKLGKGKWHATMLVVVSQAENGSTTVYNAGHQRPLLYSPEAKKLSSVRAVGPVLGLQPTSEFSEKSLSLSPGDFLLSYTDGLVEAQNKHGARYSPKKIQKVFRNLVTSDAESLAAHLERDWQRFTDGKPVGDDTCFVTMKVCA